MSFTTPHTFVVGEVVSASEMNRLSSNDLAFSAPPGASLVYTGTTSAFTTSTTISFTGAERNSDSNWAITPNPTRLTINTAGHYVIFGEASVPGVATASTAFAPELYVSGVLLRSKVTVDASATNGDSRIESVQYERLMAVADYIELKVRSLGAVSRTCNGARLSARLFAYS